MVHFVAPDIIAELRGLSLAACGIGIGIGFFLWLLGWWAHRFWIVLFSTIGAGLLGLSAGRFFGVQPFVAGLLMAVAAGMLALAVARIMAFAASGMVAWYLTGLVVPDWDAAIAAFLIGGLGGLILYRVWMMVLTSFSGTLVMTYFSLCLADKLGKLNALVWAEERWMMLNWVCLGATLMGVAAQYLVHRISQRAPKSPKDAPVAVPDKGPEVLSRRSWRPWRTRVQGRAA